MNDTPAPAAAAGTITIGGDLRVNRLGFGAMRLTGPGIWGDPKDLQAARRVLHRALELGIDFIDTADSYGPDVSERLIAETLHPYPRGLVIATKGGLVRPARDVWERRGNPAHLRQACEASLKRLRVERIDLYQLHWPAPQPIPETAAACAELLGAGKIRAIGVSNFSVAELEAWRATGVPLACLQSPYSLLRPAVGSAQLPWCATHGVGAIAYSPLFRGLLFGTWPRDKTFPPEDGRSTHKDYQGARFQRHLDAVDALKAIAARGGLSCAQLCVGMLLRTPGLDGCIVGARDARQGALIASLAVAVNDEQARDVRQVIEDLERDLA